MIDNATVLTYAPIKARNSEGTIVNTWGYIKTLLLLGLWDDGQAWDDTLPWGEAAAMIRADVQPASLTEAQLQMWGLSNVKSDVKKMFFDGEPSVVLPNRVGVHYDASGVEYYDVRGTNRWSWHTEAYLVPVQGEGL